ncbi:hypothetical protein [Bacillus alkalisoli]|uniref:hypothetical protein n=1 Tax=Bacillus alkalisoli TaxID=2011008 RepID=UPI000C23C6D6|nr:hypothetical protein [Bacillus alkalisoli]
MQTNIQKVGCILLFYIFSGVNLVGCEKEKKLADSFEELSFKNKVSKEVELKQEEEQKLVAARVQELKEIERKKQEE